MPNVTQLLQAMDAGNPRAADQLLPLVYEELRTLAAAKMAQEKPGQTLQATALVHEAWLRLAGTDERKAWNSRGHFFGAAAEAMRRILVERARRRSAVKRGGGEVPLELEAIEEFSPPVTDEGLLRVNDALDALAAVDPQMAELVKLRYFVGLSFEETGAALGIAVPTAKQWWAYARAWLSVELRKAGRKS